MIWLLAWLFMWVVYLPLLFLLRSFFYIFPKVRERFHFEKKNKIEDGSQSFKKVGLKADLCFEFSSEGEYQQVASLIDDALLAGKKIELVFFSPSVERTIIALYKKFPVQIRYFRYPILDLSFSNWITANDLILVRYDLFPEFLVWSLKSPHRLMFVWVTFKKERIGDKGISLFKRAFLAKSSLTFFATTEDLKIAKTLGLDGYVFDFRMEQIKRRVEQKMEKFSQIFPLYLNFRDHLNSYPREKRLLLGNVWPEDIELLKDIPEDNFLTIIPHKLDDLIVAQIFSLLKSLGREPVIIDDQTIHFTPSKTYLLIKKGILCELYQDFGKAYVGGGFGASVHSLLEPLIAGSDHLSCGPVHYRSTEFDLARFYGDMMEVKNNQEFLFWLKRDISNHQVYAKIQSQITSYEHYKKELISC